MTLTAGVRLGSYEIRSPLGRGGVGEVYRAWDPRLEREVAVKILHERSEMDPDRVWRFIAEARAASALNHPNIISVFDAAVDGATPYIVSELIEGESLRSEVQRGPVPLRRLLDLATQIADGLSHAHAAGIVHRDLKPENIMVTRAGRAKILDFGLARTTGFQSPFGTPDTIDGQTVTEPGLLAGTIPYMSPEQARGNPTDFRTDQFSFGLVLYEMATGRPAFRRATPAQTLEAITNDEPAPLTALTARTPLALRWMIERCLAKDPEERYGVTSDLHRDLRMLRDRLAEAVPQTEPPAPGRASIRTRMALGAALLGAFVAGAMLLAILAEPTAADPSTLRFTPFATEARYEGLPAWSPDGLTIAYSAEVNGTLQIFTRTLTSATAAPVTDAPFDCKYPFWSADGKRIYYVSRAKTRDGIWSVGAAGGTPQVVVENALRGAVSPDGRTLAFLRDEEQAEIVGSVSLFLATPEGLEPWSSEAVEKAATKYTGFDDLRFVEGALAFAPDGRSLGLMAVPNIAIPLRLDTDYERWRFWVVPLAEGGRPRPRLSWWLDPVPRVTASSLTWLDSRHVVLSIATLSTPGTHLWMADLERDRVWRLTASADSESFPSSSPGGGQIVFSRGDPDYDIVELSVSGTPPQAVLATAQKEADPAWSPDGNIMAYVTDRRGLDEIWVRNRVGQTPDRPLIEQATFVDQNIALFAPVFSPDSQRIAYLRTGGRGLMALQVYTSSVAGSPPVRLLPASHASFQGAPTWSADGQWIAFAEWKGRERHWDLTKFRVGSPEEPIVLRRDGVPNANPQWSPKDDWITWETEAGFVLVSPDGKRERRLELDQWLVHAWSRDGSSILGIVETEDLRLSLVSVDINKETTKVLADLGPSPPVNNPVQGFSLSRDGRTILTSFVRMRGDLWLLEGFRRPESVWRRLWPGRTLAAGRE